MTREYKENQTEKIKFGSGDDSYIFLGDKMYRNFTGHNLILNENFYLFGNLILNERILLPIGHALCDITGYDLDFVWPNTVLSFYDKSVIVSDSYFFFKRKRNRLSFDELNRHSSVIQFFTEIPFRLLISESEFFYRLTDNELLFKKYDNRYIQLFDEIVDCTKFDKETPQNAEKK